MTAIPISPAMNPSLPAVRPRLDYLDATRAFALILGVVFHASLAYLPIFIGWPVQDVSPIRAVGAFLTISHAFRLELFFLLAGFFGHLTLRRQGMASLIKSRTIRIILPFLVGWFLLRPLVVSGWVMAQTFPQPDFSFWKCIVIGFMDLKRLPAGLWVGTHLWFLYYLALISALVLVGRQMLKAFPAVFDFWARAADRAVKVMSTSGWALPVAVVIMVPLLSQMNGWGVDTPDKSLVPHGPALLLYGSFFGLGWLLDRQPDCITNFSRFTGTRGVMAGLGIGVTLYLGRFQLDPSHPHHHLAHHGYNVSYAIMMWSMVWLTIGVFRRWFNRPRPGVRYLADSSYWMYLIHLPIVVCLQVTVAELALPGIIKLGLISAVTIAIALITYDLFARSTWMGAVLNGRRRDREIFRFERAAVSGLPV